MEAQTETKKKDANGKAAASRVNKLTGILVDAICDAHVRRVAAALVVDVADLTPEQAVVALATHFRDRIRDGESEVQCSHCMGYSTIVESLGALGETCPYCNDGLSAEGALATDARNEHDDGEETEIPVTDEDDAPPALAADPSIVEVASAPSPEPPAAALPSIAAAPAVDPTEIDARAIEAAVPGVLASPAPAQAAKGKSAKKPKVQTAPTQAPAPKSVVERADGSDARKPAAASTSLVAASPSPSAALAPVPMMTRALIDMVLEPSEERTEARLDALLRAFRVAESDGWVAWRRQGLALAMIFGPELYRLRDPQKAKYKDFDAFVKKEIGSVAGNVYDWIKAALVFDEETAKALGKSKSILIAQLAPDIRKYVVQRTLEGRLKTPQLKAAVTAANAAVGAGKGGKVTTRKGLVRNQKGGRPVQKITIASFEGKEQIKLFASDKEGASTKQRAQKLSQVPVGERRSITGIVETFRVAMTAHGLVLVIEGKRAPKG
jgi:hypothetical protein